MTIEQFKISPLAISREDADGTTVRLAVRLSIEDTGSTKLANITFNDSGRSIPIQQITFTDRAEISWLGIEGSVFTAREIRPSDAPLAEVYGYDLPVQVLKAVAYGQLENPMTLQAVVDNADNRVLTLLLATDAGLYARFDTLWHPVTDPEVFVDAYLMDVYEDAIQLYDAADSTGSQVAAAAMPTSKNTGSAEVPLPPDADIPAEQGLIAAAIPVILNSEDLETAITAAADTPAIRWYVEKRAAALGLEAEFPWQ